MSPRRFHVALAFLSIALMALGLGGCTVEEIVTASAFTAVPSVTPAPLITASPEPSQTPTRVTIVLPTFPPTRTYLPTKSPTITPTPGPPRAEMELIFADEFDGDVLDETKWMPCYPWNDRGCTNSGNNELEWYLPENVEVSGGLLRLRADKRLISAADGKQYPYTSGMVSSYQRFDVTYAYIEMSARVPKGRGLWPAFWTLPSTLEWPPEIDVMEILGHETTVVYTTLHYKLPEAAHRSTGDSFQSGDFADGFHIYAVDWRPDEIVWYVDGNPVFSTRDNVPQQPMYLLANLAVGGNWPGSPDADTVFPSYYEIDYIRVYRDAGLSFTPAP